MRGKKEFLADIIYRLGLLKRINHRLPSRLVVYNYHRLKPDKILSGMTYDEDVFGPTAKTFKEQIRWLKSNTRIISEKELIGFINKSIFPRQICSMITFDDGYIDNYTLAYPILREEGVPAIFFIPSRSIDTRKLGWWDIISCILKNTAKESIEIDGKKLLIKNSYKQAKYYFLQKLKLESHEKTLHLLNELSEKCEVPFPEVEIQGKELMDWKQIKEISENNIAIGSHTHSHHVLSTLTIDKQADEIERSKYNISQCIGKDVHSISYPVGGYQHFSCETQMIVKNCGYQLAFSFNTGVNDWKNINRLDIKRITPSEHKNLFEATTLLSGILVKRTAHQNVN